MITETGNTYTEKLSWSEFLTHTQVMPFPERQASCVTLDPYTDIFQGKGIRKYQDAIDLAVKGWKEGAKLVAQQTKKYVDLISAKVERLDYRYDVEGIGIDIGRYCEGIPECWVSPQYTQVDGVGQHLVRICVNVGALGRRSVSEIERRGIAIATFVEVMEYAGKSVELSICFPAISHDSKTSTLIVRVKEFDQRLDSDKVAYALIHPAKHRCLKFRWIELLPESWWNSFRGSYGSSRDLSVSEQANFDVYVPSIETVCPRESEMETWITKLLKDNDVKFTD